jgi:hypothetical protein
MPSESKGDPNLRWTFIGSGIFEAIGVISFGISRLISFCMPPQYISDLWLLEETDCG